MSVANIISFPGLGIGEFTIRKAAFSIFGHPIMWYGIIITFGMILACLYVIYRAKEQGISADTIIELAMYTIVFGIIGARLYYVLTKLEEFDHFAEVFQIWNGGLGIYGGIILGAATIIIYVRYYLKKSPLLFLDMIAPAVMIGQIVGRFGNFTNGEAYGSETTLPWRMGLQKIYSGGYVASPIYVHPTFLYESLWNLIGFIWINLFYKHKKYDGQIFYMYLAWYGFGRMLIELLRSDSLYICNYHAWFTKISVIVGFFCFAICVGLLIYKEIKSSQKEKK